MVIRRNKKKSKDQLVNGATEFQKKVAKSRKCFSNNDDTVSQRDAILENIPDIAWLKDHDGRYISVNDLFCKQFGKNREDIIFKTDFDIFPQKQAKKQTEDDLEIMKSGISKEIEETYADEMCEIKFRKIIKKPIFDSEKKVIGLTGISRDQTNLKLAEEKLKEYSKNLDNMALLKNIELNRALFDMEEAKDRTDTILKSVSDGLIVTDSYDKITMMNRAAEDILGIRFPDVINRPIDKAIKDETFGYNFKDKSKNLPFNEFDFTVQADVKDQKRIINIQTSIIEDKIGKLSGIVSIIRDVTKDRESDRIKTEFISTAAHELRTPLTSIQGFSELLMSREDMQEIEKKRFLNYINKQAVSLSKIISDLLDISRIESGQSFELNKELHDICIIIKQVVDLFKESTSLNTFILNLPDEEIRLMVDKEKLNQILKNLLSNAVKYSRGSAKIIVIGQKKDDFFQISISDKGIGLTKEQVAKIFDKFYRVNSTNTAPEGTGLGMTIVKYLVEMHGGKIWVESGLNVGTTVVFTIPI